MGVSLNRRKGHNAYRETPAADTQPNGCRPNGNRGNLIRAYPNILVFTCLGALRCQCGCSGREATEFARHIVGDGTSSFRAPLQSLHGDEEIAVGAARFVVAGLRSRGIRLLQVLHTAQLLNTHHRSKSLARSDRFAGGSPVLFSMTPPRGVRSFGSRMW